jgi:release factor glutamine methyltransferase
MDSSMSNLVERGGGPWPIANDETSIRDWLVQRINSDVEKSEVLSVVGICLDFVSQKGRGERMIEGFKYSESLIDRLALIGDGLAEGSPVQYLLKSAHFDGLDLFVDLHVLIPRPETEELVFSIVERLGEGFNGRVLDIGTGSGCIALSLKNRMLKAEVFATDFSEPALKVASKNAESYNLKVAFECSDILSEAPFIGQTFDAVISNPPYIPFIEKKSMSSTVVDHEPSMALFVPDSEPLRFYQAIINHCKSELLLPGGLMAVECHENFTEDVKDLIVSGMGFSTVEILLDMQGKNRHVIAVKNV